MTLLFKQLGKKRHASGRQCENSARTQPPRGNGPVPEVRSGRGTGEGGTEVPRSFYEALAIVPILLTLICPNLASGQTTNITIAPSGDRFATYSAALSSEADRLLATSALAFVPAPPRQVPPETSGQESHLSGSQFDDFVLRFWNGRDNDLTEALRRLQSLRPLVEPILREEGVPPELSVVMLIESAGQRDALSRRNARGLWQFIPATARRYGLEVNESVDERLSVEKSTRAAARYLRDLHLRFGDWALALAAYNAGESAVLQAIGRSGSGDFGELSRRKLLPAETRTYVPAILAALNLLKGERTIASGPQANKKRLTARIVHATAAREVRIEEP
jgi:soluble lytic murein transglycosylase-like protein